MYRTEIVGGELRHETDESTDRAAWCTREELETLPLVEMGALRRAARVRGAAVIRIPIRYGAAVAVDPPDPRAPARGSRTSRSTATTVKVRMGWGFRATFSRLDVIEVVDHRPVVSIGAHGWKGRWLVNGAHRPIATIRLVAPGARPGARLPGARCASCS